MSDNTVLPTGVGGDTIRTIDRTTSKTQVIALDYGGEAGPESLVTSTTPLPVGDSTSQGLNTQLLQLIEMQRMELALLKAINQHLSHISQVTFDPMEFLNDFLIQ